jgi:hypothetical protein
VSVEGERLVRAHGALSPEMGEGVEGFARESVIVNCLVFIDLLLTYQILLFSLLLPSQF